MRKKVLFMIIHMNIGGTEKALLNMIKQMPQEKYEITVLMLEGNGPLLDALPKHVHLKYLDGYQQYVKEMLNHPVKEKVIQLMGQGRILRGLHLLSVQILAKVMNNRAIFLKYVLRNIPPLKDKYDIAIAYAGPMDLISYFVVEKIQAKLKMQWIHFDVTKIGFDHKFAKKYYHSFDQLYVVSKESKEKFGNKFPTLQGKTEVFYNVISPREIKQQSRSEKGFDDNFTGVRILTVGRLALEKGQDLAIKVLARLKNEGYDVNWYCIGDGADRETYKKLIEKYELQDSFMLLGAKENPYPYMRQCDIYVQPSRYEGYCITLSEAKVLSKPIITTDFSGAKEQIKHEATGLITGVHEEEIYQALKRLLDYPAQRKALSKALLQSKMIGTDEKDPFGHFSQLI